VYELGMGEEGGSGRWEGCWANIVISKDGRAGTGEGYLVLFVSGLRMAYLVLGTRVGHGRGWRRDLNSRKLNIRY